MLKNTGLHLDPLVMKVLSDLRPKRCSASELIRKMAVTYILNEDFRNVVDQEHRQEFSEIADDIELKVREQEK